MSYGFIKLLFSFLLIIKGLIFIINKYTFRFAALFVDNSISEFRTVGI